MSEQDSGIFCDASLENAARAEHLYVRIENIIIPFYHGIRGGSGTVGSAGCLRETRYCLSIKDDVEAELYPSPAQGGKKNKKFSIDC